MLYSRKHSNGITFEGAHKRVQAYAEAMSPRAEGEITLLDRQDIAVPRALDEFARHGWNARAVEFFQTLATTLVTPRILVARCFWQTACTIFAVA